MAPRTDRAIGALTVGSLTLVLLTALMVPAVLLPLLLAHLLPDAEPVHHFTWWQLVLVALGLFALLSGFEALAWRLPLLLVPLRRPWYVAWGHEVVELAALAWVYTELVRPWPVAVLSAAVVTLLGFLLHEFLTDEQVSAAPPRS